jgi:hypothetical protein
MTPMGLKSTPFLSYHEINTRKIDIYDDAYGFSQQFNDVIGLLNLVKPLPGRRLTRRMIEKTRKIQ